jgi:hypothetical protein
MVTELLLGDNPFIGVSHLAQEKAREEMKESVVENNAAVVRAAVEGGATGFTFTTHPTNLELLTYLSAENENLLRSMNYYILVPYAQSYVTEANIDGTPGLVRSILSKSSIPDILSAALSLKLERATELLVNRDVAPYLKILPRERVKAVFLHEILTDLIVAFDLLKVLECLKHWAQRVGVGFGLETRNFSYVRDYLARSNFLPGCVMTPMNPLGYQMAASKQAVEAGVKDLSADTKLLAINTLASGVVSLDEAIRYMQRWKSMVYGVTSASTKPGRIRQNFQRLRVLLENEGVNTSAN